MKDWVRTKLLDGCTTQQIIAQHTKSALPCIEDGTADRDCFLSSQDIRNIAHKLARLTWKLHDNEAQSVRLFYQEHSEYMFLYEEEHAGQPPAVAQRQPAANRSTATCRQCPASRKCQLTATSDAAAPAEVCHGLGHTVHDEQHAEIRQQQHNSVQQSMPVKQTRSVKQSNKGSQTAEMREVPPLPTANSEEGMHLDQGTESFASWPVDDLVVLQLFELTVDDV